jgi:hypothetical protein
MNAAEAAKKKKEDYADAQKRKKDKKAAAAAKSSAGQAKNSTGATDQPEFTKMDIRVGQISKVSDDLNANLKRVSQNTFEDTDPTMYILLCINFYIMVIDRFGCIQRQTNCFANKLMSAKRLDIAKSLLDCVDTMSWRKCKTRKYWSCAISKFPRLLGLPATVWYLLPR